MSTIRLDALSISKEKSIFSLKPLEDLFLDMKDFISSSLPVKGARKVIDSFLIVLTNPVN